MLVLIGLKLYIDENTNIMILSVYVRAIVPSLLRLPESYAHANIPLVD